MIKQAYQVNAYCQALNHFINNPQDLYEMGIANASRSEMFTAEEVHDAMEFIYHRLD